MLRNEVYLTVINLRQATEKTNQLVTQLIQITGEINQGRGTAGWLLNDTVTRHQVNATLMSLNTTGKKLQAASDSVQVMLQQLKAGQGTIHTLLYDTTAASNLRKSILSVKEGTEKFNENMEALQRSAFLKKYFKEEKKKK